MKKETIQLILGLKVRLQRQEKGMTFQQLSEKSGITVSYLHDIEKGKKQPSTNKLLQLSEALDCSYDDLVAIHGSKKLKPLVDLLESEFLEDYPLEMFGIDPSALVELLSKSPEKIGAFVGTLVKIVRNYHLSSESLYQSALRAYQDMHDNYFAELEQAVFRFREQFKLPKSPGGIAPNRLEAILEKNYGIKTDYSALVKRPETQGTRSYFSIKNETFYINYNLTDVQTNFLLARELAFHFLGLTPRPYETVLRSTANFDTLLHNFQASYFASALLMDEFSLKKDLEKLFEKSNWKADDWLALLRRYQITPEMFAQRLTNILPKHFGINDLFFIRINGNETLNDFRMSKELHLSGQQSPYATERSEHYCRRWISIGILRALRTASLGEDSLLCDAQVSDYYGTENSYFCLSMAKNDPRYPKRGVSVTLGLLINEHLRRTVRFVQDESIRRKLVNTTCETCPIEDCGARAAAPSEIDKTRAAMKVKAALAEL